MIEFLEALSFYSCDCDREIWRSEDDHINIFINGDGTYDVTLGDEEVEYLSVSFATAATIVASIFRDGYYRG